jgi:spore germination protein GerM
MPLIDSPEAAKRLARAIASDIMLYNEEKIKKGIEEDNFFEILEKEIEEGKKLYNSRIEKNILETTNFYEKALVDLIIRNKGMRIKSKIW